MRSSTIVDEEKRKILLDKLRQQSVQLAVDALKRAVIAGEVGDENMRTFEIDNAVREIAKAMGRVES